MRMMIPRINNYYIRDDGLMIFIESLGDTAFQFKVILGVGFYTIGAHEFEFISNIYDYKQLDKKIGKRFDKLITQ